MSDDLAFELGEAALVARLGLDAEAKECVALAARAYVAVQSYAVGVEEAAHADLHVQVAVGKGHAQQD